MNEIEPSFDVDNNTNTNGTTSSTSTTTSTTSSTSSDNYYSPVCLLCGSGGSDCSQILEDNRNKWSSSWCSLFNIHKDEVKLMIESAFYCVECKNELETIDSLLTESEKIHSRLEIIKLNNLYKLKDSIRSVSAQSREENVEDKLKKRLMLFECMQNSSSVHLSSPLTGNRTNNIVLTQPSPSVNSSNENQPSENVMTEALELNGNHQFVDRNPEISLLNNMECDILANPIDLDLIDERIVSPTCSNNNNSSTSSSSVVTVKTLNTTTTKLNPFIHAFQAELNSLSVPKDDDGLVLQRLNNLKELTIKVKKVSATPTPQNAGFQIQQTTSFSGQQPQQQPLLENNVCVFTIDLKTPNALQSKVRVQELDSFADCDTIELPGDNYWGEINLTDSPEPAPPFIDLVDSDEESNAVEVLHDQSVRPEPPVNQQGRTENLFQVPPSELRNSLLEEFKILEQIHSPKVSAGGQGTSQQQQQQLQVNTASFLAPFVEDTSEARYTNSRNLNSANLGSSDQLATAVLEGTHQDFPSQSLGRIVKLSFECIHSQCGRLFDSELKRDAHVKRLHEGIKYPYTCTTCAAGFANFGDLDEHEGSHKGIPRLACSQNGCLLEFYTTTKLTQHQRMFHSQQHYLCKICGKLFNSKKKHREHKLRQHTIAKFKFHVNIVRATTNNKKRVKGFQCKFCKSKFGFHSELKAHEAEASHTRSDYRFKCDKCHYSTPFKNCFSRHLRSTHTDDDSLLTFGCGTCVMKFRTLQELQDHEEVTLKCQGQGHGSEPSKRKMISCEMCGRCFEDGHSLRNHMRTRHHAKKSCLCTHCGKCFTLQRLLNSHINSIHKHSSRSGASRRKSRKITATSSQLS